MTDWTAKQAARKSAAAAMQAAFPKLIPVGGKVDGLNAAAKNMRIELKDAFPGVKFSVRSDRYSGGDSIDVNWTDGPTTEQVEEISKKYQAGTFDGMTDCYNYESDAWTDAFGDAKYVFANRSYSDKALESAIRTVKVKYAGNLAAMSINDISVADYRAGKLYSVDIMNNGNDYWSLQSIICREALRRTWALTKSPKVVMSDVEGEAA
jgi:hypothetical protein